MYFKRDSEFQVKIRLKRPSLDVHFEKLKCLKSDVKSNHSGRENLEFSKNIFCKAPPTFLKHIRGYLIKLSLQVALLEFLHLLSVLHHSSPLSQTFQIQFLECVNES